MLILCLLLMATVSSDNSNTQIVPYQQLSFMKTFSKESRDFNSSVGKWKLMQNWNDHGVAGVIWNAAIVLSKYLEGHKELLYNANIIELGSGTGLVSMIAGSLGASNVIVTDKQIEMIKTNIKANENNLVNTSITVEQYEWGQPLPTSISPPYDIILGSDIVYIEDTYISLISTLNMLSNDKTMILLSLQERYCKVQQFLDLLRDNNFIYNDVYSENSVKVYQICKAIKK